MKRILFLALLVFLMIGPAIAQPEPPVDPGGAMTLMTQVFEFFKAYAPWLIVLAITQFLKKTVLEHLVEWLRRIMTMAISFIVSALVWLLFSLPAFNVATWLQNAAAAWVLAVFGYDLAKAVVKAVQAIYKGFKGEVIE